MAKVTLRLLGCFDVQKDGMPVIGLKTDKSRALLAYLAVEGRPQQRAHLAGLLWPDWPEATARAYLRQALSNVRQVLGEDHTSEPLLLATRQWIQINPGSDIWVDVHDLKQGLKLLPGLDIKRAGPAGATQLQAAVDLYQGRLLAGFYLDGCPGFEEWHLLTGEELQRLVVVALRFLAHWYAAQGNIQQAQQAARRSVELEPLFDEPNRHLMLLMTLAGEPSAALAHFERYRQLLADELGALPPVQTSALVEKIREGRLPETTGPSVRVEEGLILPVFLASPPPSRIPIFVAREQELAELERTLATAIAGEGGVVFVLGDAGQGKTALLREFGRRAMQAHPNLLAAGGSCSSYGGIGDPLLPFRSILSQLTGDLEVPWTAGAMDRAQVQRLWSSAPSTLEALLVHGPDLVGTFLTIPSLLARVVRMPLSTAWRAQLEQLASRASSEPAADRSRHGHFDQFLTVLRTLAHSHPLLLWLDDLHWVDRESLSLLFYLGQQLMGSPILVVGAYRAEEVAQWRDDGLHPLYTVIHELQRRSGYRSVNLNGADGRDFVDAFLDSTPNRLASGFRSRLYHLSGGQPLFTVELLRTMQERGDLILDGAGYWVEGASLAWEALPIRVGAVIGQRIARLPKGLRRLLVLASVQGEQFSAEVVAAALDKPVRVVVQQLSDELERRHQLVRAEGSRYAGSKRLTYYRFQHVLFQKYLVDSLDAVECVHLHEAVAHALEALYAGQKELLAVAGELAWHYQEANLPEHAIRHRLLAAQWAVSLSAYQEAHDHLQQGLALLDRLVDTEQRRGFELDLLAELAHVQSMVHGAGSIQVEQTLKQAQGIGHQCAATPTLFAVVFRRWEHHFQRGEIRTAELVAKQCLDTADLIQDPALQAEAHTALGTTLYRLGQMAPAQHHLAISRELADSQRCSGSQFTREIDAAVNSRSNEAIPLWYLGYPDQARQRIEEALVLAEAQANIYVQVFALIFATGLCQRGRDSAQALHYGERVVRLSAEHKLAMWEAVGALYCGWARVTQGEFQAGLAQTQESLYGAQRTGLQHVRYAAVLADAYSCAGHVPAALSLIEQLLATVAVTEEREWEAELYRQKGELLLAHNGNAGGEAAACFRAAIVVAREQQAKMLELRATLSLSRLWQRQGKRSEARTSLATVYAWFTEGFDTPDLQEAHALLVGLSKATR